MQQREVALPGWVVSRSSEFTREMQRVYIGYEVGIQICRRTGQVSAVLGQWAQSGSVRDDTGYRTQSCTMATNTGQARRMFRFH